MTIELLDSGTHPAGCDLWRTGDPDDCTCDGDGLDVDEVWSR